MGRRKLTYTYSNNAASAVQERLNRSSYRLEWAHLLDVRAHWRHLANTVKRLCAATVSESATTEGVGDAACSQTTLDSLVNCNTEEHELPKIRHIIKIRNLILSRYEISQHT